MYEYKAKVISVTDGDTIRLDIDLGFSIIMRNTPVRLLGINAPEISTPEGVVSKTYLKELLPLGTSVTLQSHKDKSEKYGRILGTIMVKSGDTAAPLHKRIVVDGNINNHMVSKGYAVPYMTTT